MNLDRAADLAIDSIINGGCSDITSAFIEEKWIKEFRDEFLAHVKKMLKRGSVDEMELRPLQYILTPKNRYVFDYRKAAIINPTCLAIYNTLVFQYADRVEEERISIDENIVFSYRFNPKPGGKYLFDQNINYGAWMERTKELASDDSCKFIVSCDIAAFYDRINIHRIESTLDNIGVDKKLIKHTNKLLLFWSKKDSYGIPVGNIASRILAEVALIDVDQYLLSEEIKFTRYVDDYRLFAPDLLTSQKWMNKLTNRLFRDGLMLNIGKTNIRRTKEPEKAIEQKIESEEDSAEKVLKVITKLTGGYNRIVKKFNKPAKEKHAQYKAINIDEEIKTLTNQTIVEFEGIKKVVCAALIQEKFNRLIEIAKICSDYLYGLDYFIDMLLKNYEFIPEKEKSEIAEFYEDFIIKADLYSFEWHCASIAKLLSHNDYFRKNALLHLFVKPGKDISTYASIIALEGLSNNITRSEFKTIREYFDRCDEWEKRRLVWLSSALPCEERRAWARAIEATIKTDFLCSSYVKSIIKTKAK